MGKSNSLSSNRQKQLLAIEILKTNINKTIDKSNSLSSNRQKQQLAIE
jgi:hypothetical protein